MKFTSLFSGLNGALCISILIANGVFANSNLSKIQSEIQQQQSKINQQRQQRNSLQANLKNQEIEMGQVLNKLKATESNLADTRLAIQRTEKEIKRLEGQEKLQKEKLKEQLDSAYRSGIHPSMIEKILSDTAKDADRMSAYYEHMNQVRIDAIHDLRRTQAELKARRDELQGQQKGQQTQLSEQKKHQVDLKKVQQDRESTIRSLDKNLAQAENRLESLKSNELALRQQIEKATKEAQQQENKAIAQLEQQKSSQGKPKVTEQEKQQMRAGNGLGTPRQQYRTPVSGKLVNRFNAIQMGEIRWSGIVIQANAGTPVRAIAPGKVILASWLDGYGHMVVIDHGNGDMSLYGHNQSIAVQLGARVKEGQIIARVGNSGGQSRSALYFEIRRKGVVSNPTRWVKIGNS